MNNRRALPTSIVLLSIVCGSLFSACTPEVRNYGSGGSGGSGGSDSSSSTSSGGMPCMSDSDCGASSECQTFTCVNGACTVNFAAAGTIVAQQAIGDCQTNVCDGKGYVVSNPEPGDPANDNNPCTNDTCNGPTTMYEPVAAGTSCDGAQFCNGVGFCVQCLADGDCPGGVCFKEQCVPAQCSDGQTDGLETDVDCGGPSCPQCPPGLKCGVDKDCNSISCQGGICAPPTCMDGLPNGLETGIDCGGPDCPVCADGSPCKNNLDCKSHVCTAGICQPPVCDDQVLNGGESDVDCGGPCPACANGRACFADNDCVSNRCCPGPGPGEPGYCENPMQVCLALLRSEEHK